MKKIYASLGIALAATLSLTNCSKELDSPAVSASEGIPFEVTTLITRTANDGLATKWAADDAINLYHADADGTAYTSDGKFTVDAALAGTFSGKLDASYDGTVAHDWYAYYPYGAANSTPAGIEGATLGGISQTQAGNSSRAHLAGAACPLYGVAKAVAADATPSFVMKQLTSVICVEVTNASGADFTVSSVVFTSTEDIVGTYNIGFTGDAVTYTAGSSVSSTASLTVSGGEAIANGSSAKFYIAIKPHTAASGSTLKLSVNGSERTVNLSKDAVFAAGEIRSLTFKLAGTGVTGTGTAADPYIVSDADQFTSTVSGHPDSCIKLASDISLTSWTSVAEFSGTLDGDSHSVSGLCAPFAELLSGEVKNIKFKDIDIAAGTGNCGAIANKLSGKVNSVAVQGKLSAPTKATSGDTGLSPVAGQAIESAVIDNCYVNVETTIVGGNFAFGGLVGVIKETGNITMSNSTIDGKVSSSQHITKIGGVLGRKTNSNQTSKDIITGCLVNMEIAITGTGSNMVGGIFGALQGSTVSGGYVGGLTIEKSAFMGSVSAGNAVGGIGGVCCSVRDCYVGGKVQATSVTSGSTAAAAGVAAAVKGDVTRCVVAGARVTGGPKGTTTYTAGVASVQNGNTPNTTYCYVLNTVIETSSFAIYGTATNKIKASDNYRWNVTYSTEPSAYVPKDTDTYGQDGTEKQMTQADLTALGYDFTSVWKWDSEASAPVLRSVGCADSVIIK